MHSPPNNPLTVLIILSPVVAFRSSCLSHPRTFILDITRIDLHLRRIVRLQALASLSAFGLWYHRHSGHYFYNWLDSKVEGNGAAAVFYKVAIDQILWCPLFMTVFFTYLGLVNGDSFAIIGDNIKSDLLTVCQGS